MKTTVLISVTVILFVCSAACPVPSRAQNRIMSKAEKTQLVSDLTAAFDTLKWRSVRPAEGYIKFDYLIPAGFYKQMWDWDGFFIGCYLASHSKEDAKYLRWWVLNFAGSADAEGYVPGCITTKGPRPIFGKFAMKPFLAQGAYFASVYGGDFTWITPEVYETLKRVTRYREKTQLDTVYGLYFWDLAIQSGADNNPALTNDTTDRSAILAADLNTFQLREYLSLAKIAEELGHADEAAAFRAQAADLRAAMLKTLWFPDMHSFLNVRRKTGGRIARVTYSNFVPLIQKLLPEEEGKMMISLYLVNDREMWAAFGGRSLSQQDVAYNNKCMIVPYSNWQGPVWINANFLYTIALRNYGYDKDARTIAWTLAPVLLKDIKTCGSMHECYDADTGEPLAPTAAQSPGGVFTGFVGWNLLEQNMLEGAMFDRWMMLEVGF
jgi:alpha,alpha-trehalase